MKGLVVATLLVCSGWDKASSFTTIRGGTVREDSRGIISNSRGGGGSSRSTATATTTALQVSATATSLDVLEHLGLPFGLRETLLKNAETFSKRIWILDNSGSMAMHDGHQVLLEANGETPTCTRWNEVEETVNCHAQLSAAIGAPTDFRLLNPPQKNGPQSFRVGYGRHAAKDSKRAQSIMSHAHPQGKTPLASAINAVREEVVGMLPKLVAEGSKVAIVIATDGCNHGKHNIGNHQNSETERNKELTEALESLQGLPVCVVIRLCTDYEPLVDFYNGLDESLEKLNIDIDVLDDHKAEAEEVYEHNPWLNYALVIHRMREMGQHSRLFDLLDNRPLTKVEVRNFCYLLYGKLDLPDPECDWLNFLRELDRVQEKEKLQLNPRTKKLEPWINVEELAFLEEERRGLFGTRVVC